MKSVVEKNPFNPFNRGRKKSVKSVKSVVKNNPLNLFNRGRKELHKLELRLIRVIRFQDLSVPYIVPVWSTL